MRYQYFFYTVTVAGVRDCVKWRDLCKHRSYGVCVCYQFKIWTDFGWMNCFALKFVEAVMKLDEAICGNLHMAQTRSLTCHHQHISYVCD